MYWGAWEATWDMGGESGGGRTHGFFKIVDGSLPSKIGYISTQSNIL